MEPGRDLDALVAEKVMGLSGEAEDPMSCDVCRKPFYFDSNAKPYSTDIKAAWEVVERAKLFTEQMLILAHNGFDNKWVICEEVNPAGIQGIIAEAETVPHAICLASLKVVGYES